MTQEQWFRVENAANQRNISPNQLFVEFAMKALDCREWPRTEAEIHLLRSALFSAQAIAREMIAEGREHEVDEIRRSISKMSPALSSTT